MIRAALVAAAAGLMLCATPLRAEPVEDATMAVPAVGFPFVASYVADGLGLWAKTWRPIRLLHT